MTSALLQISNLIVHQGKQKVLDVPELDIAPGEILAVIGPNGAGKSTLLLAISQLIKPTSGQIIFQGKDITTDIKEYRRHFSLILQEPLLLSTSVYHNVATGLQFRHLPKPEIADRVNKWLERLGIAALRGRPARTLSGGEAQRVSLARAFALQTELLLLDEPFSALDAPTRAGLISDFQDIIATTGQTAVFITHDLDEALMLGSRMAVLMGGKLRQVDHPEVIFSAPADPEVAAFVGVETIIPGSVLSNQDGLIIIQGRDFQIEAVGAINPGRAVYACLRPEDVTLWNTSVVPFSSARNRLSGRVKRLVPQGPLVHVEVDCGIPIVSLVTRTSTREMDLQPGHEVALTFKASAVHVIQR